MYRKATKVFLQIFLTETIVLGNSVSVFFYLPILFHDDISAQIWSDIVLQTLGVGLLTSLNVDTLRICRVTHAKLLATPIKRE